MSDVEWRPWPQDPRYLVGSDGTILGPWGRPWQSYPIKGGYLGLSLRLASGKRVGTTRHRVVCEAFHGPCPDGMEAAHKNGVSTDCRAENLQWKTAPRNAADRVPHGTNGVRLTAEQVQEIRNSAEAGQSRAILARRYEVSVAAIQQVLIGRTWQHLPWADGQQPQRGAPPETVLNFGPPPTGEDHHLARLTEDAVREIRTRHAEGQRGVISEMARKYGVTVATVRSVVQRKTWKHVV